jgi:ADP-ribosylation factor-like protein 3
VFVIDSSDQFRIEESGNELRKILEEDKLANLPLLILANKQDLNFALAPDEIIDLLNLNNISDRIWSIVACSAVTKQGKEDNYN